MEIFSPHENIWLIAISGYVLLLLFTFVIAFRLDKFGIRTRAKIISSGSEISSEISTIDGEYDSESTKYLVLVEYTHDKKNIQVKMSIEGRFKMEKYKTYLPIIYNKNKFRNPSVDDTLTIYQAPIALSIVLIICIVTSLITINIS